MKLTNYHVLPENHLIPLLKNGDREAFEEIFNRYYHFLLQYADQLTHDSQQSEDLIQEIFIRAWQNRERFDDSKNLFNYLKVSVRNGFLNQERTKTTHTAFKKELTHYLTAGYTTADQGMIEKELIARLESIAAALPGKMGKVFMMTHFENCSNEEIALALGVSEKTVKNLLSQAVGNIRLRMGLSLALAILLS
ncbi:RNA polymerase sigma factor [Sphingobacterium sp. SYP-B4668]|uniref:RNA polymerase sigma factor n=1 Tax=Sphingobacterium sp. SYP-B4668 TaxID=2996035 RepID=UPI0022DE8566|nr:sigma-70 family RNA polymerase sigma factor [Sphingobacterium sp. SYP-B4668]